jgi:hydroxymethylglutaryl-CoA lyase
MKLPESINVIEVGSRDGLQNLMDFIPTENKIRLIELLLAAGIRFIELTSFVHPKAIPQLSDAIEVTKTIADKYGNDPNLFFHALVPNVRGAENAVKCGLDTVCVVISVSEAHNKANINRTVDESLAGLGEIIRTFPDLKVRLDLATAFGCPFEGDVPVEKVLSLIAKAGALGAETFALCDTIGVANPAQTESVIGAIWKEFPNLPLALHLHDTRGMGIANILTGMQCGVTDIETSVGGLGGCPFAPGAAGNTATEDLLVMADQMGIQTDVNLDRYYDAMYYVRDYIKSDLTSHMVKVERKSRKICGA